MSVFCISYDLNKAGQDYESLYKAIKDVSDDWWHCLDSTWLVVTDKTALQVATAMWTVMDQNDRLLVTAVGKDSAWAGFDKQCEDWLKKNL